MGLWIGRSPSESRYGQTGRHPVDGDQHGLGRVDDDPGIACHEIGQAVRSHDLRPSRAPAFRMLAVGMAQNADPARGEDARQPLDDRLRAGRGYDVGCRVSAVSVARGLFQGGQIFCLRQAGPRLRWNFTDRIWSGVDSGG